MEYRHDDLLQLSGIQHFAFCRRQWALIHIEKLWAENYRTTDGALMHDKAHDPEFNESRGDLCIMRGVNVSSPGSAYPASAMWWSSDGARKGSA